MPDGLTFDDILILPGYTDFKRRDVSLATELHSTIVLPLPVISSPMDTVTDDAMARALAVAGGLGIIHRNLTVAAQATMVAKVNKDKLLVGAAVGIGSDFEERVAALVAAGADMLVIDSGHGNTQFMVDAIGFIKKAYAKAVVMAGNIATLDGASRLIAAGADILRVGMGPGSICTTRIITGMGVPQISAIQEAVKAVNVMKAKHVAIVADGGIRQIGDMAKALAVGADAVMLGSLLAGFDESPGDVVSVSGKKYKSYRGMGSIAAMKQGSAERYGQTRDTNERKLIPEGVEGLVGYKGSVTQYLDQVSGSLKSSFYYIGAQTLPEFHKKAEIVRITPASMIESHPHSITVTDGGQNYQI
ncbi:IMP dehydrogenase [Candidatus Gottesmanbacteria bacterium]|nr:IMP dehydrogenase [Candidatus Gottesmanbacteria bacterium]